MQWWALGALCGGAAWASWHLTKQLRPLLTGAGLSGRDLSKPHKPLLPEAAGVISGCVFLITSFLFIPVHFGDDILHVENFPHNELVELLAALLSICCMLLLGFADDVLNLRWRHKLLLPTVASLPLLVVYYVNFNSTTIIVPLPLREWFGHTVNIGFLYYIYMGMLAVFCTNAINILAGINGLEAGQSIVIGISIMIFNIVELCREFHKTHVFSLYIILPYLATTIGLLQQNWYPAEVFVGDTFCYLSGMTFAVVGILGHFSKTLLLFFIPQIFNFIYSLPQLFHIIPCPRHRMPKYVTESDKLIASTFKVPKSELGSLGLLIARIFKIFRLVEWEEKEDIITLNNFTLINLILVYIGPTHEKKLTIILLIIQVLFSCIAFCIRYPLASYFYDA